MSEQRPPWWPTAADKARADAAATGTFTVEKRCPRRSNPDRHEEAQADLTFREAVDLVDDLAGVQDGDGISELEVGQHHVWADDETGDEVEARRDG